MIIVMLSKLQHLYVMIILYYNYNKIIYFLATVKPSNYITEFEEDSTQ